MKFTKNLILLFVVALTFSIPVFANPIPGLNSIVKTATPPKGFKDGIIKVNGVKIHYVVGGSGQALLLIHGFGQNWYTWNRVMPELARHFTVIAPDLTGLGESGKPEKGYDKKTMARDLHGLMVKLTFQSVEIAGHGVGAMVAYAYAAQFPKEVKKLILMDTAIPGIEPFWAQETAKAWWFGFCAMPASADLVASRPKTFFNSFWSVQAYNKVAFTQAERTEFVRSYYTSGSMDYSFRWFAALGQDIADNREFSKTKLEMPVLAMGADHSTGAGLATQIRYLATDVTEQLISNSGHWMMQEQTAQVQQAMLGFLLK